MASLASIRRYKRRRRACHIQRHHGIRIDENQRREFRRRIFDGDYFFMEIESRRRHHYIMNVKDKLIRVVYDPVFNCFADFLSGKTANDRLFGEQK